MIRKVKLTIFILFENGVKLRSLKNVPCNITHQIKLLNHYVVAFHHIILVFSFHFKRECLIFYGVKTRHGIKTF